MRPWRSIRTSSACAIRHSGNPELAWLGAADDAHEAYLSWQRAGRRERADAFVAYLAAVDREEAAARALELVAAVGPPLFR